MDPLPTSTGVSCAGAIEGVRVTVSAVAVPVACAAAREGEALYRHRCVIGGE
jgi:hypothetical protein